MKLEKIWLLLVALGLAGTAIIAFWLGLQDAFWPVSLSAQLLGAFFIIAGFGAAAGAVILVIEALPLRRWKRINGTQVAYIAGGAMAGIYVDLTIVVHSFRYQPGWAWLFGALALSCAIMAFQTLPAAWKYISKSVKGVGITLALLGSAANFWFQSFYLPENTQVGIEYALSLGPVVRTGGERFVTLDLTMDNESPVSALTIGSMVVVSGVSYTKAGKENALSDAAAQQRAALYANDLAGQPAGGSAAVQNPNVRFNGNQSSTALTILRPVNNGSYLFPDDTYTRNFDVIIPASGIVALDVKIYVQYARTTRLVLGRRITPVIRNYGSCPDDEQSAWYVNQSALVRFTRGTQVLYSDWCAELAHPFIGWHVAGAGGTHDSRKAEDDISSNINVISSSRDEVFVLH